jgi:hypothetical protein
MEIAVAMNIARHQDGVWRPGIRIALIVTVETNKHWTVGDRR